MPDPEDFLFSMNATLILCSLILGALLCDAASADEKYPCRADQRSSTGMSEKSGSIDHKYIVRHTLGQFRFDIPYGYIIRRPSPEFVNCPGDKLAFAFWMPDLRAPQDDMWSQPSYRVQEPGRPEPVADEYIISVISATPRKHADLSTRFTAHVGRFEKPYRLDFEDGLLHVLFDENNSAFDDYFDLSSTDEQYHIFCTKEDVNLPNPSCRADIYLNDINLGLFVQFPLDALPHWKEIGQGARTLLKRWQVNT